MLLLKSNPSDLWCFLFIYRQLVWEWMLTIVMAVLTCQVLSVPADFSWYSSLLSCFIWFICFLGACFAGSGDSSTEREFFAGLRGPTVSTPNSQHSSPSRSVSGPYSSYRHLYLCMYPLAVSMLVKSLFCSLSSKFHQSGALQRWRSR